MQISEAFKRFGISDGDDSVLVVLVHSEDEPQLLSDIKSLVNGQQVPVEDVSLLTDQEKIKKVYLSFYVTLAMGYRAVCSKRHFHYRNMAEFSYIQFPTQWKAVYFVLQYTSETFLLILFCFLCFSCTKSLHKRRSAEPYWMQLYAGWPSKMPCSPISFRG